VAFAPQQAERTLRRHRYDTIVEGVGSDRVTSNFAAALPRITGALSCSDAEAVEMSRYLLRCDGIFCGSSTALNMVGVVKAARALGPGHTIVTLLCDSGLRHLSRLWSEEYIAKAGLTPTCAGDATDLSFVQ
jgi:cysteine synthase A